VNTLAEAVAMVRRIGKPAFRTMVDTLAASLMEPEPVADAIVRLMATGFMAHIQLNDRNKRGPGQGEDKFAPVMRALRETKYDGWIAMEPFVYEPDGATCAARMIGYVAGLLEQG
jgi:sugar phosphate isomerase/epimerase